MCPLLRGSSVLKSKLWCIDRCCRKPHSNSSSLVKFCWNRSKQLLHVDAVFWIIYTKAPISIILFFTNSLEHLLCIISINFQTLQINIYESSRRVKLFTLRRLSPNEVISIKVLTFKTLESLQFLRSRSILTLELFIKTFSINTPNIMMIVFGSVSVLKTKMSFSSIFAIGVMHLSA